MLVVHDLLLYVQVSACFGHAETQPNIVFRGSNYGKRTGIMQISAALPKGMAL
jgi:hypothetical protein